MFRELFRRRVPQILGAYVAALWIAVEISSWIAENFPVPGELALYVFAGMLSMLPAVATVAWFHGAPGREEWHRAELLIIPANLVLAAVVLALVVRPVDLDAAIEPMTIVGPAGDLETYQVAREGYYRRAYLSFFPTTGEPWFAYAAPVLIAQDMSAEPLLLARTAFNYPSARERMESAGFDEALGEPLPLSLEITRDLVLDILIRGKHEQLADGSHRLSAEIFNIETGRSVGLVEATASAFLDAVENLSTALRATIFSEELALDQQSLADDLHVSERATENLDALKAYTKALTAFRLHNDLAKAERLIEQAIALDPTFSLALGLKFQSRIGQGDFQGAVAAAEAALRHGYKLNRDQKFILTGNSFWLQGNHDAAYQTFVNWTEVDPRNPEAFEAKAEIALQTSREVDEARDALFKALDLNPRAREILLQLANAEMLDGNIRGAIPFIEDYLAERPLDARALTTLAQVHIRLGEFDEAAEAYQKVQLANPSEIDGELGLAYIDFMQGLFAKVEDRCDRMRERAGSDEQRYKVAFLASLNAAGQGKSELALRRLTEARELSRMVLPPMQQVLQLESFRVSFLALVGRGAEADRVIAGMREQLQPPLVHLVAFAEAAVAEVFDQRERFRTAVDELDALEGVLPEQFITGFKLPLEAQIAQWDGEHERAMELIGRSEDTIARSPVMLEDPSILLEIRRRKAEIMLASGAIDDSIELLSEIIELFPSYVDARIARTRALIVASRFTEAELELERVMELLRDADPDYRLADEARQLEVELANRTSAITSSL